MKRYLFCVILASNLVVGMDEPPEGKKTLDDAVAQEIAQIEAALPDEAVASGDIVYSDEAIKQMSKQQLDMLYAEKAEIPPAAIERYAQLAQVDLAQQIEDSVESWSIEQIKDYLARNSGKAHPSNSKFLEKFVARCQQLNFDPKDLPAAEVSSAVQSAEAELPSFDTIPGMNEQELNAYEAALKAQKKFTQFLENAIADQRAVLARVEAANAALKAEPDIARSKSPRRVRFEGIVDSGGSDIARPAHPVAVADIPAPFERKNFVDPDEGSDSGERMQGDAAQVRKTTISPRLAEEPSASGSEPSLVPVKEGDDPLSLAPAPTPIRQTETLEGDGAPPSESYRMDLLRHAAVEPKKAAAANNNSNASASAAPAAAPAKAKVPDVSEDAQVAAKLTEQLAQERQETPGGPAEELRVEPVAGTGGEAKRTGVKVASVKDLKEAASEDEKSESESEEDKTPGGPDEPEAGSESESDKGLDSGSESDSSSSSSKDKKEWNNLQKGLIAAAVVTVLYGGTEMVLAYKSIPEKEWKETSGFVNKAQLVLGKTWENVKARPYQGVDLLKKLAHKARLA